MFSNKSSDIFPIVQGLKIIVNAILKENEKSFPKIMNLSYLQTLSNKRFEDFGNIASNFNIDQIQDLKEVIERLLVVEKGLSQYSNLKIKKAFDINSSSYYLKKDICSLNSELYVYNLTKDPKQSAITSFEKNEYTKNEILDDFRKPSTRYSSVKEKIDIVDATHKEIPEINLSDKDRKLLLKLEKEYEEKINKQSSKSETNDNLTMTALNSREKKKLFEEKPRPSSSMKPKDMLSKNSKAKKVPASRIGRLVSFGTLGVGLGIGTLAEYSRRSLGMKNRSVGDTFDSMFLTKANAERIVSTLCKVRGAALKIGQILSIQDNTIISPELQEAFERVRQSADFMPVWQVEKVLSRQLGDNWRSKLNTFDEKPFAAASIGQVHHATLSGGRPVAIKIQYPGVAAGINSDIENLVGIMKIWNIFPEGMFIDNIVEVAKRELAWEIDYIREAECTKLYRKLVDPYPEYYVPEVIESLCSAQVFTTELIEGVPVDKCTDYDLETKEYICRLIMNLCLKELFVFRYMQTDPNWSNFYFNQRTKQLILLDFGACRSYSKQFMDDYIEVINAASEGDKDKVLALSKKMGFLTGYESKLMKAAHVDAVMILGQVFDRDQEYFDFGGQNVTKRIQALVPTILHHRLCPPPEEIYSLHRKLSGVFLLCAKMNVKINCRDMFLEVYKNYQHGGIDY